jgi:hypothetical protein
MNSVSISSKHFVQSDVFIVFAHFGSVIRRSSGKSDPAFKVARPLTVIVADTVLFGSYTFNLSQIADKWCVSMVMIHSFTAEFSLARCRLSHLFPQLASRFSQYEFPSMDHISGVRFVNYINGLFGEADRRTFGAPRGRDFPH